MVTGAATGLAPATVTGAAATGLVPTTGAATVVVGATLVVTGAAATTPAPTTGAPTTPAAGPGILACPAYLASRGPSSVVVPTTACPSPVALTESFSLIPPLVVSV